MIKTACYVKVWWFLGVIPVWKVERVLDDEEVDAMLAERMKALSADFFAAQDEFQGKVKEAVLDEISRAFAANAKGMGAKNE